MTLENNPVTQSSRVRLTPEPASRFPDLASVTGTVDLVDLGVATVRWDGRAGVSCWRVGDLEVATTSVPLTYLDR